MSQRRDFAIPNDPATVELRAFYDTSCTITFISLALRPFLTNVASSAVKLTPLLLRKIDFLQNYVVKLTTPPHGDYGINCSSRLHLVLRLRGGGHPDEEVRSGFAAGGKISQKINRDPLPTIAYDHSRAQQFHITVINAAYFTSLTGLPCPPSPISPQTYLRHKLPWFTLYDEDIPTANNAKSVTPLAGVRSIAQVDAIRAKADCAYCVHQMATKSASPCGHGVCDECSTVSACPSCQKRITGWQQFTEVVPMPGHEDDDGVEALSLDERIVRLKSCHYGRVMSFRVKGSDVSPLCR
jgi:hypothetical protein